MTKQISLFPEQDTHTIYCGRCGKKIITFETEKLLNAVCRKCRLVIGNKHLQKNPEK